MDRISNFLDAAQKLAVNQNPEVYERWIATFHKLSAGYGVSFLTRMANARIDLLLRALEHEHLETIREKKQIDAMSFAFDIQISLSENWVLNCYEMLRSACQLDRERGARNEKLVHLRNRLALIRIPIAKAEIAKTDKNTPEILLGVPDSDEAPKPYKRDGSYIIPTAICTNTGSVLWFAVDVDTMSNVQIFRRDLSDEFLAVFD